MREEDNLCDQGIYGSIVLEMVIKKSFVKGLILKNKIYPTQ